jgi:hypothetical protein
VLCIEFELESGAAGAEVDESDGALGDVDCCFEQATIASALRHNKRRLRFIRSPHCIAVYLTTGADYRAGGPASPRTLPAPGGTQRLDASSVPSQYFCVPASSRLRPPTKPLLCCEPSRCFWGK